MKICFVTFGISPFEDGDTGTLYGNLLNAYSRAGCDYSVLLYGSHIISNAEFRSAYPNVTLHTLNTAAPETEVALPGRMNDPSSFDSAEAWTSYLIMRKLEQIEASGNSFDIIEFVDFGGPAFFTIQQKHLGRSFQKADIVIRLLGTDSMLRRFETRPWLYANMPLADIEQQAIARADYCVSHLLANAKAYHSLYGLPDAWLSRAKIELPPLGIQYRTISTNLIHRSTSLCFSSSSQESKRSGLFLAGVCELMISTPHYKGSAFFTEITADTNFADTLKLGIPEKLSKRIVFTTSEKARHKLISESIVIFPSIFETFCCKAYEASLSGAVVILNELNPAFGSDSPWRHGTNCLKFDGSIDGLVTLLRSLFDRTGLDDLTSRLRPAEYRHAEYPYWVKEREPAVLKKPAPFVKSPPPAISVIIPVKDSPETLLMQLQDLAELTDRSYEIILVDRGSQQPILRHLLDTLHVENWSIYGNHTVRVLRRTQAINYGAAVNAGIGAVRNRIVAILPGRQRDTSRFIGSAADTIANARADVVLPTLRIVRRPDDLDVVKYWSSLGGAIRTNLFTNRFGFGCFVARRDDLLDQRFDETLGGEWSWDVLQRLAFSGKIFSVDPDRGISLTENDMGRWNTTDEVKRRAFVEAIRRNAFYVSRQLDLPWEYLGDGELTSSEWYINPAVRVAMEQEVEKHHREMCALNARVEDLNKEHKVAMQRSEMAASERLEEERQRHRVAQEAYTALATARAVRFALGIENLAKRILNMSR